MGFNPKTWGTDEYPTAAKMNQAKDSLNWLFAAAIPALDDDVGVLEAVTSLGFFIVHFWPISPVADNGTGSYDAAWTRLWGPPNVGFAMEITWPDTIFSGTPIILGHTVGSDKEFFGRAPVAHWDESATGYSVAIKDTGGDQYPVNTPFSYSALVVGTRKTSPA